MKNWNKNINVPNALSLFRIVLIVPFVYYFLHDQIVPAAACLVLSGLSDMFDGMIARKFHQITELGKMLDPVADKLTQGTVAVCLAIEQPVLIPLLAIFIVKELLMLVAGSFLVLKKQGGNHSFLFFICRHCVPKGVFPDRKPRSDGHVAFCDSGIYDLCFYPIL